MTGTQQAVAQVRCNSAGEWHLRIRGTDVCELLYRYRHPELDPFPGNAMGHRLIEMGWMPDRRAMFAVRGESTVDTLLRTMLAGWTPSSTEQWVWTIPVHRDTD